MKRWAWVVTQYLDADNAGTGSLARDAERPALVEAARAQQPVTQPTAAVHAVAACPLAFSRTIHQRGQYQGRCAVTLIAPKQFTAEGWFGQTDFSLCLKHVDSDGDARQDSVFITVWKQWDFTWGWTAPSPPRGWLGGGWNRLQRLFKRHGGQHLWCQCPQHGQHQGWWCCTALCAGRCRCMGPIAWGDTRWRRPAASGPASKRGAGAGLCAQRHRPGTHAPPLWAALHEEIPRAPHGPRPRPVHRALQRLVGQRKKRPVGRPVLDGRTPATTCTRARPWGRARS